MRKTAKQVLLTVLLTGALALPVLAGYPASGESVPKGSVLLEGEIIGEEVGWGGNPSVGAAAAFDGHRSTYYDPTTAGADYAYCGMEMEQKYILTKVCIHPRQGQESRFLGGSIQGSNDMENWYTLFESEREGSYSWQVITEFDCNIGYKYYRYWNGVNHGDVGDIELYGYAGSNGTDPYDVSESAVRSEVKVSFDPQTEASETDKLPEKTVVIGESYTELPQPEWEGYVFDGWYTAPEGGLSVAEGSGVTRLSDHTLYAHWLTPEEAEQRRTEGTENPADGTGASSASTDENAAEESLYKLPVPFLIAAGVFAAAAAVVSILKKDSV